LARCLSDKRHSAGAERLRKFSENNDYFQHLVGGRYGSFDFALWVGFCGWAKTNVSNVGWQNFKFICAVEKKLKHEALGCRVGKKSARWSVFIAVGLMSFGQI